MDNSEYGPLTASLFSQREDARFVTRPKLIKGEVGSVLVPFNSSFSSEELLPAMKTARKIKAVVDRVEEEGAMSSEQVQARFVRDCGFAYSGNKACGKYVDQTLSVPLGDSQYREWIKNQLRQKRFRPALQEGGPRGKDHWERETGARVKGTVLEICPAPFNPELANDGAIRAAKETLCTLCDIHISQITHCLDPTTLEMRPYQDDYVSALWYRLIREWAERKVSICERCRQPFLQNKKGRQSKFCSKGCRDKQYYSDCKGTIMEQRKLRKKTKEAKVSDED